MCPGDHVSTSTAITKLPDHLLMDIFIRVPTSEWVELCCVKKQWAQLFQDESLWHAALLRNFPSAGNATRRWPGPIIPHNLSKRRYLALYIGKYMFPTNGELDEMLGYAYLFLKDQLHLSTMPPPAAILHGTLIDQFISCGESRDRAHELASQIWVAVIDNLEENQQTFILLKRLALEEDIFLPYPYSRSKEVVWRVFEKLFTDFRDCFKGDDYYDILACAKHKFQPIPSIWLGF